MKKKRTAILLALLAALSVGGVLGAKLLGSGDWKAPELSLADSFQAACGVPVSFYDLIESVSDRSDFSLSFSGEGEIDQREKTITFSDVGTFSVEVTAEDIHGNSTTETTEIIVTDQTAPVLRTEDFSCCEGDEPDYAAHITAEDAVDGDLSAAVKVDTSGADLNSPGSYEISCSVEDAAGNRVEQTLILTVTQRPAEKITLSREELWLAGNEYEQLEATVEPSDWEGTVQWSSSDTGVATVHNGLVVWKGAGSCTITAAADEVKAECKLTCSAPAASALWLNDHSVKLAEGQSVTLTAQTWPSNWSGDVTWTSSDPTVATVEGGAITWVGPGSCTITAAAEEASDSCTVQCEGETVMDIINGLLPSGDILPNVGGEATYDSRGEAAP